MTETTTYPETITHDGHTVRLPFARLLPDLAPDEFDALKADIQQRGIQVPLLISKLADENGTLWDIIDGQHRFRAAQELSIPWADIPKDIRIDLEPQEAAALAFVLNVKRRQLTKDQRDAAAVELRQAGLSYRKIADALGMASQETARRAVLAAGPEAQPDTITGADGKEYEAVTEKTRTQQLADKIMALFDDTPKLHVKDIRAALTDSEAGILEHALNFLLADRKLQHVPGERGFYELTDDPDWSAVILDTLRDAGPLTFAEITSDLRRKLKRTFLPPAFSTALRAMKKEGEIIQDAISRYHLPLQGEDAPAPLSADEQVYNLLLAQGPFTYDGLINAVTTRELGEHPIPVANRLIGAGRAFKRLGEDGEEIYGAVTARAADPDPSLDDLKKFRAAIRHALVTTGSDFFTISDVAYRTGYTSEEIVDMAEYMIAAGQLRQHDKDSWEPITAASQDPADQPDFTVDQVKETLLTAFGGSDRPATKSMILYYVRQQLKGFGKNIPFEDALSELELEGEVAPTGRTNPAGDPFYALVFPPPEADHPDYGAEILAVLREHGPQKAVNLIPLVREQIGDEFDEDKFRIARARMLGGPIILDSDNRYTLAEDRTVAEMDGEPVTAAQIPGYDGLQHAAELGAKFDKDKITLIGRTDNGAWHRAIEISRKLVTAGIWNGTDQIEFDAYALHDKLFGVNPLTPAQLDPGNHYSFVHPSKNGRVVSGYSPAVIKILDALYSAEKPYFVYQVKNHAGISDEEAKNGIALLLEHGRVEVVEPEYPGQNKRYQLARATDHKAESPAAESTDARDGDQPDPAPDRTGQDRDDSAAKAAPEDVPQPEPVEPDDTITPEQARAQILERLSGVAYMHINTLLALGIPQRLVSETLRALIHERKIRKTRDQWYERIEPHAELRLALDALMTAYGHVQTEVRMLPMEDMTDGQRAQLHAEIERSQRTAGTIAQALSELDAWLTQPVPESV